MQNNCHYDEAEKSVIAQFAQFTGNAMREDESVFAARELDFVKAKIYEKKRPPMIGLSLVPIASDVPEYAETVVYKTYDTVGMAKIVAIMPMTCHALMFWVRSITVRVKTVADSYGFNIMEPFRL